MPPQPLIGFWSRRRLLTAVMACATGPFGAIGLVGFVRGTWADSEPRVPASVEAGPVCHLYDMPGEGKQVRCAVLLPYSLDRVWQAVTDYDNYGDICSCVHAADLTYDPNGTMHFEGSVQSPLPALPHPWGEGSRSALPHRWGEGSRSALPPRVGEGSRPGLPPRVGEGWVWGDIPFAADVTHEQMLDRYRTTWDQPCGDVIVNRGHWILTPTGPAETLLELTLEVQMRHVPTFILRNISMHRLPEVVRAVGERLRTNRAGKPWGGGG